MSIAACGFFVELQDRFFVSLVLMLTGRGFASAPTVICAPAHPQRFAKLAHFVGAEALLYESILLHSSLAK